MADCTVCGAANVAVQTAMDGRDHCGCVTTPCPICDDPTCAGIVVHQLAIVHRALRWAKEGRNHG